MDSNQRLFIPEMENDVSLFFENLDVRLLVNVSRGPQQYLLFPHLSDDSN